MPMLEAADSITPNKRDQQVYLYLSYGYVDEPLSASPPTNGATSATRLLVAKNGGYCDW